MGIKNLTKFIKETVPEAISIVSLDSYKDSAIAIDASILFYTFNVIGLTKEINNNSSERNDTNHLYGFFIKTISLLEKDIKPIYVFDGISPIEKKETIKKRLETKEKYRKEANNLENKLNEKLENKLNEKLNTDIEENNDEIEQIEIEQIENEEINNLKESLEKVKLRTYYPKKHEIEEIKQMLDYLNVEYINAPSEAEATCSLLCKKGLVKAVLSEDMDCLAHGCPKLLRKMKDAPNKYMEISLDKILTKLNFTQDQFIDYCLLCGSDYLETIKGIGYKKAFKLIQESKWSGPENIKNLFKLEEPYEIKNKGKNLKEINKESLLELLVSKNNFNKNIVENNLNKLNKDSQPKITNFFKKVKL